MSSFVTRRDFIRGATLAFLGAAVGLAQESSKTSPKSRLVLIRHPEALDENSQFNEEVIQRLLDEAVMKLFDQDDPVAAFRQIIKPADIVV